MIGILHTCCATLALVLGAVILLTRKGTVVHVRLGWVYLLSMTTMNLLALFIYRITGGLNVFHIIAIISLAMIVAVMVQIAMRGKLRRWLWRHYQYVTWSYVSLLAGASNEAFVHIQFMRRLAATWGKGLPLVASAVIVAASAWIIFRCQRSILMKYGWADAQTVYDNDQ
jgi:uncharacterized membrane protein